MSETNRDKALRGEVVKVTHERLLDMQRQSIAGEGVGFEDYHWHWVAVINELIELRRVVRHVGSHVDMEQKCIVWCDSAVAEVDAYRG